MLRPSGQSPFRTTSVAFGARRRNVTLWSLEISGECRAGPRPMPLPRRPDAPAGGPGGCAYIVKARTDDNTAIFIFIRESLWFFLSGFPQRRSRVHTTATRGESAQLCD